ncbi:MAG TPA: oxygen-independent coproporphyrinogen III oxidase [Rhodanobacter sp.]|nr:oxygen-independent coproporphyrinogen III oxidase [Rhodanobacter sp.]
MVIAVTAPEFDPALSARYDVAGPRYTSYPPVSQFRADFDEQALRHAIRTSNEEPIPRPLSIYVHVPFCPGPCFYCGCTRVVTSDKAQAGRYLERLYREIELLAPLFDRDRPVRQLHLVGGTPDFLDLAGMRELVESLTRHFSFSRASDREYAIEVDPRFADAAYIQGLGELGFNCLSLGIQDFAPPVQRAIHREQSVAQTRAVIEAARAARFRAVNVDLVYGLPLQDVESFGRTLDTVVALQPERIAVHGYAHLTQVPEVRRQVDAQAMPDSALRLALLGCALQRLTAAGYVHLGLEHFARADDELALAQRAGTLQRSFQGYSTHGECDIVGLGVSAIGRIGDSYSQNARDLLGYYAALDNGRLSVGCGLQLDEDDVIRRELIGALMCRGIIDKATFGARHRLLFDEYFVRARQRLQPLVADGLVAEDARAIRVTARGRLLLRIIARCFDAYLDGVAQTARYLRVI